MVQVISLPPHAEHCTFSSAAPTATLACARASRTCGAISDACRQAVQVHAGLAL